MMQPSGNSQDYGGLNQIQMESDVNCACIRMGFFSCAMNTNWVWWSNFFFLCGNVVYIAYDLLNYDCLEYRTPVFGRPVCDDDSNVAIYLDISGAVLFMFNPITDLFGTIAEKLVEGEVEKNHQAEIMDAEANGLNDMFDTTGIVQVADINVEQRPPLPRDSSNFSMQDGESSEGEEKREPGCCGCPPMDEINWDKYVAIVFLIGSSLYLWLAILDLYDMEDVWYYDIIDLAASHIMLLDSCLALLSWYINRVEMKGTGRERHLLAFRPYQVDWSGLGDWLFFFGSILDATISYADGADEYTLISLSFASNMLWLVDSIFYILGSIFGQQVRRRFAETYYTSLAHVEKLDKEDIESLNRHNVSMLDDNLIELTPRRLKKSPGA